MARGPALGLVGLLLAAGCSGAEESDSGRSGSDSGTPPPSASTPRAGGPSASIGPTLVGASGDTLHLAAPPRRIVALIPGVNRILIELGGLDRIVARTDYDTVSALADLPSVGGGIGPDLERLATLRPDLVIRFEGAQDARTGDRLDDLGIPHLGVRPDGIEDLRRIIGTMGRALEREDAAARMVAEIDRGLDEIRAAVAPLPRYRIAWILGGTPPLAAGPGTFLQELVEIAGGENVFADLGELYTTVSLETFLRREIDVLIVGEGADPDPRITDGLRVVRVPSHVQIPGPDIVASAWIVARAVHPELGSEPEPEPDGGAIRDRRTGIDPR